MTRLVSRTHYNLPRVKKPALLAKTRKASHPSPLTPHPSPLTPHPSPLVGY